MLPYCPQDLQAAAGSANLGANRTRATGEWGRVRMALGNMGYRLEGLRHHPFVSFLSRPSAWSQLALIYLSSPLCLSSELGSEHHQLGWQPSPGSSEPHICHLGGPSRWVGTLQVLGARVTSGVSAPEACLALSFWLYLSTGLGGNHAWAVPRKPRNHSCALFWEEECVCESYCIC